VSQWQSASIEEARPHLEDSMKKSALAVAAVFTALIPAAYGQDYRYRDYRDADTARVVDSTPVYASSNAREECWNPRARVYEERRDNAGHDARVGGTVIGAIAGGVLGHQVGSGHGNDAATVGGAILGGVIGNQVGRQHDSNQQTDLDLSRCRRVGGGGTGNIVGYDVRYVYRGQEYNTRLAGDPGRRIRVNPDGSPL
jgi:uncharacterized protein YcfJ